MESENKQKLKLIDSENRLVVTKGWGWGWAKCEGGQNVQISSYKISKS